MFPVTEGSIEAEEIAAAAPTATTAAVWIDIDDIEPNPWQPRSRIPKKRLAGLIKSINENGQIQAAAVRPKPGSRTKYQLLAGQRRHLSVEAGANAGIKEPNPHLYVGKLRCEIVSKTDQEMFDAAYAENEDREPMSIFDKARYYQKMREFESERLTSERLTPVSNAKNLGAAVTKDNMLSWEALVPIRKKQGRPIPGARTLRRIVAVLGLSEDIQDRLADINLASEADEESGKFEGVSEKHANALFLIPDEKTRLALVDEIEKEKLGANETLRRANKIVGIKPTQKSEETSKSDNLASSEKSAGKSLNTGNTPASSVSNSTDTPAKSKLDDDIVSAYLEPAAKSVSEAGRVWEQISVNPEYREKVEQGVAALESKLKELKQSIRRKK